MRHGLGLAVLAATVAACGGGGGSGSGSAPFAVAGAPAPAGTLYPVTLASGWFDGDAYPDVAICDQLTTEVRILLGQPGGGFTPRAPVTFGIPSTPALIGTGFFDFDGFADIVTVREDEHAVLLGNGDGTFTPAAAFITALLPGKDVSAIAVGRMNADSFDDVAYGTKDGHVGVALSTGTGSFVPGGDVALLAPDEVKSLAVADLDATGSLDVVALQGGGVLLALAGNGAGGLAPPVAPISIGGTPRAIAVGAFDNDVGLDVAVVDDLHEQVRLYSGALGPTILLPPLATVALDGQGISVATYHQLFALNDSLVVTSIDPAFESGDVMYLTGDLTTGEWTGASVLGGAVVPLGLVVTDMSLDGLPDLIVGFAVPGASPSVDGYVQSLFATGG